MTPNRSIYFRSLLFILPVFAAALVIPLVLASSNSGLLLRYLPALLFITGFAVVLMVGLTAWLGYKLLLQWKTRQFGSRIASRLALEISLIAVLPCLLIYAVSSQFIGRSIDSWFNVRIEHALDSGVELSRASIAHFQTQTADRTQLMADALSDLPDADRSELLPNLRERYGLNNAFILGKSGTIIATAMTTVSQKLQIPTVEQMAAALQQGIYTTLLEDPPSAIQQGKMYRFSPSHPFGMKATSRPRCVSTRSFPCPSRLNPQGSSKSRPFFLSSKNRSPDSWRQTSAP